MHERIFIIKNYLIFTQNHLSHSARLCLIENLIVIQLKLKKEEKLMSI